jgi:methylenetetrahydrofolate dehydrogenase (NADP+)/methenyltetrahydrofolate cyclohydrolase
MKESCLIMDGRLVAQRVLDQCSQRVKTIVAATGVVPCLAAVLVGDDPASATYVKMKSKRCESVGMTSRVVTMPNTTTTRELLDTIRALGADKAIHGILLQHPVPHQIDERAAFEAIPVEKDVDGVTATSFGEMAFGSEIAFGACTPAGIMRLLAEYKVDLKGKHAVVIGRSAILGKPMALMLLNAHATVTICHSRTPDVAAEVKRADVLVAAVGKAHFVKGDWIKPGAVVIDAGYTQGNLGDVDTEAAKQKASMLTPVPGGVGPMTIAILIDQTITAASRMLKVKA